jgi:sporulation protein YlmC with PRC-barrel domain
MARQEIHVELLLGKRVYALNGRAIGRVEEVCAELHRGTASVALSGRKVRHLRKTLGAGNRACCSGLVWIVGEEWVPGQVGPD